MLRLLIALPFLLVLILFALSNQQPVTLAFWPTDLQLVVPLSAAMLAAMAAAFLVGALIVWFPALAARRRARRFERQARRLEAEKQAREKAAATPGTAVAVR